MEMLPCRHRLVPNRESHCYRETARYTEQGRALMFHRRDGDGPVRCDRALAAACPYREGTGPPRGPRMISCPHCHRRHREGSNSHLLCEAWGSTKRELARLRRERPQGRGYYEHGTMELPYDEHTTLLVRRLVWQRLQSAVLRRDRHRCQDCGADFRGRRRKVLDPSRRCGYRWESLEVHHIVARAEGGSDHPGNLKTLCPTCHRAYTRALNADLVERRREDRILIAALKEQGYEDHMVDDPRDDEW